MTTPRKQPSSRASGLSAALRYAALRYAALRYAALRYAALRYAALRYAALRALVVLAVWAAPAVAIAEEPTMEEVKYHPAERPPDGTGGRLMLTGAALMVGWYGVSVGTSYLWSDAPNSDDLRLPFIGPWKALGDTGCGASEGSSCTTVTVVLRTSLAVVSGIGQAGGLLAFVEGLFLDTGAAPTPAPKRSANAGAHDVGFGHTWTAAPVVLPDGGGLEIVGRF